MEHPQPPVDLSEGDDEALVEAARRDPEAFGVLYQRYLPQIYRYLRARTGNADDAADLTQQVFLKALAALPGYRPCGRPFITWLLRIARNAVADFYRRRRPTVAFDLVPEATWGAGEESPESVVLRREELVLLQALYLRLDPAKQELLALRFAAGLTVPEIAAVVGKREAAVRKQLQRVVHQLKEQFRGT